MRVISETGWIRDKDQWVLVHQGSPLLYLFKVNWDAEYRTLKEPASSGWYWSTEAEGIQFNTVFRKIEPQGPNELITTVGYRALTEYLKILELDCATAASKWHEVEARRDTIAQLVQEG